jgi:hypothetical protein
MDVTMMKRITRKWDFGESRSVVQI